MIHHLRAAGVGVIVDTRGTGVPAVLHWGRDLGATDAAALSALAAASVPAVPPSSIDVPLRLSLVPTLGEGWSGRPGVELFRDAGGADGASAARALRAPRFELVPESVTVSAPAGGADAADAANAPDAAGGTLSFELVDPDASVAVATRLELTPEGVLRMRHRIENRGGSPLGVGRAAVVLPVPARASELLDFSGLWAHERRPIRRALEHGVHAREGRHGRGGHDDAYLLAAGTPGFGFRTGEVWAVHVAWSGDTELWAERSALGPATLGGGELLAPGEVALGPGDSLETPWTVAVYSAEGLDGLSDRLHPWIRSWSTIAAGRAPWCSTRGKPSTSTSRSRSSSRSSTRPPGWAWSGSSSTTAGSWAVATTAGRSATGPSIRRSGPAASVRSSSACATRHGVRPLGRARDDERRFRARPCAPGLGARAIGGSRVAVPARARPHRAGGRRAPLRAPRRAARRQRHRLPQVGPQPRPARRLRARADPRGVRAHRPLRVAHPGVEIESCASGGARIDLGILERTDRVWPSDTNDPLERQSIHRFTSLVVPPEYLGSHLGAARAHTTGRTAELSFRLASALFGSAGIEWNLATASDAELDAVAAWTAEYRRLRPLLHGGRVVRADAADPAQLVHGVVASDRRHAVFSVAMLASATTALPPAVRMPGLDPDAHYTVRVLDLGPVRTVQDANPPWLDAGEVRLGGRMLAEVGLPMPLLAPENALVLELVAD